MEENKTKQSQKKSQEQENNDSLQLTQEKIANTDTSSVEDTAETSSQTVAIQEKGEEKLSRKQQFIQFLKFLAFSLSAGVIQILSFSVLYEWTGWLAWWPSHLISVTLSVIWNFTFNRKFTFKSASNVPLAMVLVIIYYAAYIPASVFGGNALEAIGWNGLLVEAIMMVINFITEFFWDKYIVFNDKVVNKILSKVKKGKIQNNDTDNSK